MNKIFEDKNRDKIFEEWKSADMENKFRNFCEYIMKRRAKHGE